MQPQNKPGKPFFKPTISDHMIFIGLGLAVFYWVCELLLNVFITQQIDMFYLIAGNNMASMWPRLIVLCLFIIFGSHAQFTIDNRIKAEKALKESEQRYRTLVENIPLGVCRHTPGAEGRFLMINTSLVTMLEYHSIEEMKTLQPKDIYFKFDQVKHLLSDAGGKDKNIVGEVQLKKKNHTPLWGSMTARPVYNDEKTKIIYYDCTFENIDERKKAAFKALEEERTRRKFQKLLSPDLAEMVVSGDLNVQIGGEIREATVLFADIRGFTIISEITEASELLQILNEFFESMVKTVFQWGGTVDKFIGDAIMVNWGAPVHHQDDPLRAVQAAIQMQSEIDAFNTRRLASGKQPIRVGIGINTGNLVAGYIGSNQMMSYSVIGDTVNTASRLCSIAKTGQIIISESTYCRVEHHFAVTRLDPILLKGKQSKTQIFSVICSG